MRLSGPGSWHQQNTKLRKLLRVFPRSFSCTDCLSLRRNQKFRRIFIIIEKNTRGDFQITSDVLKCCLGRDRATVFNIRETAAKQARSRRKIFRGQTLALRNSRQRLPISIAQALPCMTPFVRISATAAALELSLPPLTSSMCAQVSIFDGPPNDVG